MDNKRWIAVAAVLLLAGIVACALIFQQRNEALQRWRESREQVTELDRRIAGLNEQVESQKSQLSVEANLAEQKQAALGDLEIRTAELNTRLDERLAELDSVRSDLQQVNAERSKLKEEMAAVQKKLTDVSGERDRLEEELKARESSIVGMVDDDTRNRDLIAMLERQVAERDQRIEGLDYDIKALGNTLAVNEKQLAEYRDSLRALQAESGGLQKELVVVKASADGLDARLKELTDERDRLLAQKTDLKTEGADLQARMVALETQHQEGLAVREEKIASLSSALETCDGRLKGLEKDNGILVLELEEAGRTINGLRNQLEEVIVRVPELKDRLEQSLGKYQAVREDLTEARARQAELEDQKMAMRDTYEALVTGLKQQLDSQETSIQEYRERLKVTFVDRILFGFSQLQISPEGKAALDQLAGVLANVPQGKISITGHADSIPVSPKFRYRFPSNWELSSARAAAVARYLIERGNLEPSRIAVVGFSSYQPVADNDTEAGRAKNRRVEIVISQGRYPDW